MSFDDEHFYLGGFYPSDPSTEERAIYIHSKDMGRLFREYWQLLWHRATPLNEGKIINWVELKRIGSKLDFSDNEFDNLVAKLKDEVQKSKQHT